MHAYYFLKIVQSTRYQVQCMTRAVRYELVTKVHRLQKKFKKNHIAIRF